MKTTFYLVEDFGFMEGNIYSGSESECLAEMNRLISSGSNPKSFYVTCNRSN